MRCYIIKWQIRLISISCFVKKKKYNLRARTVKLLKSSFIVLGKNCEKELFFWSIILCSFTTNTWLYSYVNNNKDMFSVVLHTQCVLRTGPERIMSAITIDTLAVQRWIFKQPPDHKRRMDAKCRAVNCWSQRNSQRLSANV